MSVSINLCFPRNKASWQSLGKIPIPLVVPLNNDSSSGLMLDLPRLFTPESCSRGSLWKDSKSTHSNYRILEGSSIFHLNVTSPPPDSRPLSRLSRVTKAGRSPPTQRGQPHNGFGSDKRTHPKANPQGKPLFACSCSRITTFSK